MRLPTALRLVLTVFLVFSASELTAASLADRVRDGPGAEDVRTAMRLLERGENTESASDKIAWYRRGKDFAELALSKDPDSADANFAYFATWGRMIQTEGWVKNVHHLPALQRYLDRALELDPRHGPALGAKGGLYRQLPGLLGGDLEKAETYLVRAIEMDPNGVGARLELAECYLATGRQEQARTATLAALGLAREHGKPHWERRAKEILERMGNSLAQRRTGE